MVWDVEKFIFAAEYGKREEVERLLKEPGANIDAVGKDGKTALMKVVSNSYKIDRIKFLLKHGANVNAHGGIKEKVGGETAFGISVPVSYKTVKDDPGTALVVASILCEYNIVKLLLDNGARAYDTNYQGQNALDQAFEMYDISSRRRKEKKSVIKLLIDRKFYANQENQYGLKPFHDAARRGMTDVMKIFLNKKVDINSREESDDTVLHAAAAGGYQDTISLLLDRKADMNARNKKGETILHKASIKCSSEVMELLLSKKIIDINAQDKDGNTALHVAAREGNIAAAISLLEYGADDKVQNKEGKTPSENGSDTIKAAKDRVKANQITATAQAAMREAAKNPTLIMTVINECNKALDICPSHIPALLLLIKAISKDIEKTENVSLVIRKLNETGVISSFSEKDAKEYKTSIIGLATSLAKTGQYDKALDVYGATNLNASVLWTDKNIAKSYAAIVKTYSKLLLGYKKYDEAFALYEKTNSVVAGICDGIKKDALKKIRSDITKLQKNKAPTEETYLEEYKLLKCIKEADRNKEENGRITLLEMLIKTEMLEQLGQATEVTVEPSAPEKEIEPVASGSGVGKEEALQATPAEFVPAADLTAGTPQEPIAPPGTALDLDSAAQSAGLPSYLDALSALDASPSAPSEDEVDNSPAQPVKKGSGKTAQFG